MESTVLEGVKAGIKLKGIYFESITVAYPPSDGKYWFVRIGFSDLGILLAEYDCKKQTLKFRTGPNDFLELPAEEFSYWAKWENSSKTYESYIADLVDFGPLEVDMPKIQLDNIEKYVKLQSTIPGEPDWMRKDIEDSCKNE